MDQGFNRGSNRSGHIPENQMPVMIMLVLPVSSFGLGKSLLKESDFSKNSVIDLMGNPGTRTKLRHSNGVKRTDIGTRRPPLTEG